MKPRSQSCLVVADGRLPGLCAAWAAGVCGGSPAGTSWVAYPKPSGNGARGRAAVVQTYAHTCNLQGGIELPGVSDVGAGRASLGAESVDQDQSGRQGYEQSVVLLAACRAAIQQGLSRVVWPINLGGDAAQDTGAPSGKALHHIADACDRAMLAGQLANIDAGRSSQGVVIELPYVDFSDAQVMELAIDMGVPLSACWWCDGDGAAACGTCGQCVRWQRALTAVSPGATLVQVVTGRKHERVEK
ncbi:MAG: 7-cyano-7-deazaguanine synthase [Pyrinomonadaceae bacterium]|nr:7-cyano-7-deazaguanine synthase [Phycisphaerales bacterium]